MMDVSVHVVTILGNHLYLAHLDRWDGKQGVHGNMDI